MDLLTDTYKKRRLGAFYNGPTILFVYRFACRVTHFNQVLYIGGNFFLDRFYFVNVLVSTLSKSSFFICSFTVNLPVSKAHLEGIIQLFFKHGVSFCHALTGRYQNWRFSMSRLCWEVTSRGCYYFGLDIVSICKFILVHHINIATSSFSDDPWDALWYLFCLCRFFKSKDQHSSFTRLLYWANRRAI